MLDFVVKCFKLLYTSIVGPIKSWIPLQKTYYDTQMFLGE